ncbi:MAG: hypothetical protein QOF83_3656 [Solirubrobacteraceae bacterium]|jgi:predicted  nucleic acid-binding Zn-ribbon protein|nr:hypothetical protein [Solirubrobacteraceae bacterium]
MASDLTDPAAPDAQAISFAVDALAQDGDGHVEVTGRWYGVRGRRFVRPTLTAVMKSGNNERRTLADLDHKPWAAEDGEAWTAAFPLGVEIEDAAELELNVAPDITVPLGTEAVSRSEAKRNQPSRGRSSTGSRAPRVRTSPPARPTMTDRTQELERLRSRLRDLEAAHDRERTRREQAEAHLEDERTEALRLRSEVGRLGAELDLARARGDELEAAAAELETTRREAMSTGRELEAVRNDLKHTARQLKDAREHARDAGRGLEGARSEALQGERRLHETRRQVEELERERDAVSYALEQEQAEAARLRRELADSEDAVRRLAGARSGTVSRARPSGESVAASPDGESDTLFSPRTPPVEHRLEPMSPRLRALNKLEASAPTWSDRPLNPSLRSGSWFIRGLAIIVVLIVLVVIVVLINSTVA